MCAHEVRSPTCSTLSNWTLAGTFVRPAPSASSLRHTLPCAPIRAIHFAPPFAIPHTPNPR